MSAGASNPGDEGAGPLLPDRAGGGAGRVRVTAPERAIFIDAKRRLIGYWRENGDPDWPDPADFVDPEWDRGERRAVALYLDSGASSASTVEIPVALGPSTCRLCGIRNGFDEQCDASYLWPRGLAHYVEAHSVRLPREFIDHVREQVRDRNESELDPTWWRSAAPD